MNTRGEDVEMMRSRFTVMVASLSVVLAVSGQLRALAEQSPQTEQMKSSEPRTEVPPATSGTFDRYDLGAAAANVLWVPFKAGTCAISAGLGALAYIATLGAARGWSESAFEEGCVRNWLVTGADLRPAPAGPLMTSYGQSRQ